MIQVRNKLKEIWEDGEYGIHNVCVIVYKNESTGHKYDVRWRYGSHGKITFYNLTNDYRSIVKQIIKEKSKKSLSM